MKNPQPAKVAGSWKSIGKTEVMAKGQHVLGSGRLRYPKTYNPTGRIQMPGVPERLAGGSPGPGELSNGSTVSLSS